MDVRNFDDSAAKIIRKARKKAKTRMVLLGVVALLCFIISLLLFPSYIKVTGTLLFCGFLFLLGFNLASDLASMILEYVSDNRQNVENEVAARMTFLNNMNNKNKATRDNLQKSTENLQ